MFGSLREAVAGNSAKTVVFMTPIIEVLGHL